MQSSAQVSLSLPLSQLSQEERIVQFSEVVLVHAGVKADNPSLLPLCEPCRSSRSSLTAALSSKSGHRFGARIAALL